jgi:O-succinylbenzoate synthase
MRITSLEVFRYRIPLVSQLNLAGETHHFREGFIIRIYDSEGHQGVSEMAPLPGWHEETLGETHHQITDNILPILRKIKWQQDDNPYQTFLSLDIPELRLPSLQWGLELALLQLYSHQKKLNPYEILDGSVQSIIHINALLLGDGQKILQEAKNRIAEGYQTLKIKVGRAPVQEEIQLIQDLREVAGAKTNIRLDANRSWSFAEAIHFGKSVSQAGIEYIEEPLESFGHLKSFYEETGIAVALDESLYLCDPDDCPVAAGTQFLILKPSRLGGLKQFWRWIKLAEEKQLKVVISSTFESGISISVLIQLAGLIKPGPLAMGFDTLRWLKEDLLEKNISIHQGQLKVSEAADQGQNVNWKKLKLNKKFDW